MALQLQGVSRNGRKWLPRNKSDKGVNRFVRARINTRHMHTLQVYDHTTFGPWGCGLVLHSQICGALRVGAKTKKGFGW